MKRALAVAMQVAVLFGPLVAQEDLGAATKAAFCSTVQDNQARLACFDKAFPRGEYATSTTSSPAETVQAPTSWSVEKGQSAVDGTPTISATLNPAEVSGVGVTPETMSLILRCAENTTSAGFSTNLPMTEEAVPVTIGIGDAPAVTSSWSRSKTAATSVGLWRGATAIPFIRTLPDDGRLMVRIGEPNQVDAQFNLGGVVDVTRQIAEACKWPVPPPAAAPPQNAPVELGIQ